MNIPFLDLQAINLSQADQLKAAFSRVLEKGWFILGQKLPASNSSLPVIATASTASAWPMVWMPSS
jgi:hypothetical protein